MTEKEAIKYIKCRMRSEKTKDEVWQAGDMAIKAIEKQISKKPINKELKKYSGGTQVLFADCPMCEQPVKIYNGHQNNKEFRRDEDVYCNHCGQALDWSE